MKKLIALSIMHYAGKSLKKGDAFEASKQDARLLIAVGKADKAPVEPPKPSSLEKPKTVKKVLEAEGKPEKNEKTEAKPRTYRRRDMAAES